MKGKRGSRKFSRLRGPSIAGCPPWGPYDVFLEGILRQSGERKFSEKEAAFTRGGALRTVVVNPYSRAGIELRRAKSEYVRIP